MTTKSIGTMKIWKMVAESTPNTTAIPISEREFAPAPVERASGMLPTMKANYVIRIGRRRIFDASTAA